MGTAPSPPSSPSLPLGREEEEEEEGPCREWCKGMTTSVIRSYESPRIRLVGARVVVVMVGRRRARRRRGRRRRRADSRRAWMVSPRRAAWAWLMVVGRGWCGVWGCVWWVKMRCGVGVGGCACVSLLDVCVCVRAYDQLIN
jgi:hypothetical protein